MKKTNTISVAISIKDYNPTIIEVIDSFQGQSLLPLDIVVVGEHSVLDRIRRIIKSNKLVSYYDYFGDKNNARNEAILRTKGDYVIFCDHDMIAASNLLEECSKLFCKYNALIVPEVGAKSRKLFKRIFKLEKEIIQKDPDALTPRVYKKDLFDSKETPFDRRFGVLDEWGFYTKLKNKSPKIGLVRNSHFTVKDEFEFFERVKRSYKKGYCFRSLLKESNTGVKRRANLFRRGVIVYIKSFRLFFRHPFIFTLLVATKGLELVTFTGGYIIGVLGRIADSNLEKSTIQ